MGFFSKDKAEKSVENASSKQPSSMARNFFRLAFNPQIGNDLRPIQETNDVFINVLAMIFISQKMFPSDHPDYLGVGGRRLTLRTLLRTVWHDLKISRETVPQALLFFALVSSMIFSVVALVVLGISAFGAVFVHKAHADGYFTPPSGDNDIAMGWLNFLRSGDLTGDFFSQFMEPLAFAGGIQGALVTALAFYSDAILIVAAVILFYHLASMVVETAHSGQVMGKQANQIWAPIRLVVAIGLLVPVGGGLNSGQFIVFKVTEWGSGLASNVWSIFVDGIEANMNLGLVPSIPPYNPDVVYNALRMEACKYAHDKGDHGGQTAAEANNPANGNPTTTGQGSSSAIPTQGVTATKTDEEKEGCGRKSKNDTAKDTASDDTTATGAKNQGDMCYTTVLQPKAQALAQKYGSMQIQPGMGGTANQQKPPYDGEIANLIADYYACLGAPLPNPTLLGVLELSRYYGWLAAGAALSAASQAEANMNNLGGMIPEIVGPEIGGSKDPIMQTVVAPALRGMEKYIHMLPQGGASGGGGAIGGDKCAGARSQLLDQAEGMRQQGSPKDHYLERIFQMIDWIAGWNCVWVSAPDDLGLGNFSLGIMFMGGNPIAEMARLGEANIDTAYDTFDTMVNLSAGMGEENERNRLGLDLSKITGKASLANTENTGLMTTIGGLLGMITAVFFTSGIMLAYYLPLVPFMRFLFNALSWVVAVLEAVICMPLVALAHLTVQGEGLPGGMAKNAYFFIFNIALKPVLMVFGLIVGLLTFYAAVSYMNLFYGMAISTAGGLANGHEFLSRLVYSGLYVIILYMSCTTCFKTIGYLPDSANRWLGANPHTFHNMDQTEAVAGPLMSGANNIQQINSAVTQGGFGGAKAIQGLSSNGGATKALIGENRKH